MMRERVPPAGRHAPGFTLLEAVIVLLILAVGTAVAVPAFRAWLEEGSEMDVATRRVEALFRLARDSAAKTGVLVTVVIDSATATVWLDAPPPPTLDELTTFAPPRFGAVRTALSVPHAAGAAPDGEPLALPASIRLELSKARARFAFAPGGTAFGDTLVLRSSTEARSVTINPWTGDAVR
jgi:type II secretory pathway pseudopilin PulG